MAIKFRRRRRLNYHFMAFPPMAVILNRLIGRDEKKLFSRFI